MKDTKQRVKFIALIALVMAAVIVLSVCVSLFGRVARTSSDAGVSDAHGGIQVNAMESCNPLSLKVTRSGSSASNEPVTVTASYSPTNIPKPTLVWSMVYKDDQANNDAEAGNIPPCDYYINLDVAADTLSATVMYNDPFENTIVLRVENRGAAATATIDYIKPIVIQRKTDLLEVGANIGFDEISHDVTNTPNFEGLNYFDVTVGTGSAYYRNGDILPEYPDDSYIDYMLPSYPYDYEWSLILYNGSKKAQREENFHNFLNQFIDFVNGYDPSIADIFSPNFIIEMLEGNLNNFTFTIKMRSYLMNCDSTRLYSPGCYLISNLITSNYGSESYCYQFGKALDAFLAQSPSREQNFNQWRLVCETTDELGRAVKSASTKSPLLVYDYTAMLENGII